MYFWVVGTSAGGLRDWEMLLPPAGICGFGGTVLVSPVPPVDGAECSLTARESWQCVASQTTRERDGKRCVMVIN